MNIVLGILDYFMIFIVTFVAVFLGSLAAIMIMFKVIVDKMLERTDPSRREYMNGHERAYTRKTV